MKHLKFFIILLLFIAFNMAVVSASDVNDVQLDCSNSDTLNTDEYLSDGPLQDDVNNSVVKTTPVITIKSNKLNSNSTVEIHLKNSTGSPLKSTNITAIINKYSTSA